MMKEGMDTKAVVSTMTTRSRNVFRLSAAKEPRTTPMTRAKAAAMRPSLADVFMPSAMMSRTWRPLCLRDGPKLKCSTSFRYVQYCSMIGLSRPYFASIAFWTAGLTAFSPTKGPPGTACMTKNVTVITTQTVNTARITLFRMYFSVLGFIKDTLHLSRAATVIL